MVFHYKAIDNTGVVRQGVIEAVSIDVAISSLQKRGMVISEIKPEEAAGDFFSRKITLFGGVSNKDVVILSRQMATMFEAQISALRVFRMLASENENAILSRTLNDVADDVQSGSPISVSLAKHPKIFSAFYISMVRSGEESGKLDQIFIFLADYMDRTYEITSKVKNALVYPAFVVFTFIAVMVLMFTMVIPKISGILVESGQAVPFYTKIILLISSFLVDYGLLLLILAVVGGYFFWKFIGTEKGKISFDEFKITAPVIKNLYKKLYLSRVSDNMNTLLLSGVPMVRALELTAEVVDNAIYSKILNKAVEDVKSGASVSDSLNKKQGFPGIFIQMIKVGEETGELGNILKTMSNFYRREVINAVDTMVGLIEPVMIVALGLGVGVLLMSVLVPIYNISSGM